tara:strand:+ start:55 stop:318 length:264 start_codon:yes stop_codon:yes gene_type:complete
MSKVKKRDNYPCRRISDAGKVSTMNNTNTAKSSSNIAQVSWKLTHLLYETAEGKYRTLTGKGGVEAIDTDLFMQCFQDVEMILEGDG